MGRTSRTVMPALVAAAVVATTGTAYAVHGDNQHSDNMHAVDHSEDTGDFELPSDQRDANSDLAFWGNVIFHGDYDGFRVIEQSREGLREVSRTRCNGDQGDVSVWGDVLVRSWNSPAPPGRSCDGQPVEAGFEGLHVFDISDLTDPRLVASVPLECGSHTHTTVPDEADNRLVVYSNAGRGCRFTDVVEVPLGDPSGATALRKERLRGVSGCHDAGVILGQVNLLACASGDAAHVFSVGSPRGGSLEDPAFLYTIAEADDLGNEVGTGGRWHSAAFTWDGEVLVLGWEPGGGGAAECEASDPDIKKSVFFYDARDGDKLGQWTLPRAQGADENCTIHNYNVVPLQDRYVMVSGNYQAGTWVTEFTDPAKPVTVAWSDPASLGPGSFCDGACTIGGAWSSYWYNGTIYESDITRGLNTYRVSGAGLDEAATLDHLNPQTQEFSLPPRADAAVRRTA